MELQIKDSGTITLGHRESSVPLSYPDDTQTPIGFSIDLCALVVDKLKTDLSLPTSRSSTSSSNRFSLVANGTIDIECGSTANTVKNR